MNGHLTDHVTREDLELFVICALDAHRAHDVEAHVAECEACSLALAEEARLEIALIEVAAARTAQTVRAPAARVTAVPSPARAATRPARPVLPRPRIGRVVVASIGTLSLAAAWMLWLGSNTAGHTSVEPTERTTARVLANYDAGGVASLDAHHDLLDGS